MPTNGSFAHVVRHCDWIFDLFALGFDHISEHLEIPRHAAHLRAVATAHAVGRDLRPAIQQADGGIPTEVWEYLDIPAGEAAVFMPEFLDRLATTLRVIDEASGKLNYLHDVHDAHVWSGVRRRMLANGLKLNSQNGLRHVVLKPSPRFPTHGDSWWARAMRRGAVTEARVRGHHWSREFSNLCCVPDLPGCTLAHRRLTPYNDFGYTDWSRLRIGMVPLIRELDAVTAAGAPMRPGPLRIATNADNGLVIAADGPDLDMAALCAHAARAVRYLAEQEVQIVLFPEAVVPDPVVDAIRAELDTLRRAGSRYPVLVMAGTFLRGTGADGSLGQNQAIVLNLRGTVVLRQSKMHPYEMHVYEQRLYGLEGVFGGQPALEDIATAPRVLHFCDSPATGTRTVVTICEDSAQDDPCLNATRGMHANLVLIPVMAGALLGDRGFAKTVAALAVMPGCLTAVVNSGALPRAEWRNRTPTPADPPPLGIVGLPRFTLVEDDQYRPFSLLRTVRQVDDDGPEVLIFECPAEPLS